VSGASPPCPDAREHSGQWRTPDSGPCGHGVAADGPSAAQAALNAGSDSEMVSTNIRDFGRQLLAQGRISISRIDDAVRRILRVKLRAGLFEHPFVDQARATDPNSFLTPADRAAERAAAGKSMVLLKNGGGALPPTLPLDPSRSVAVIGPLGDDQHDMLGPWWGKGQDADAVSVFNGIKAQDPNTTFTQGCAMVDKDPPNNTPADECGSDAGFAAAVDAAKAADQVVLALGETRGQSGEAAARIEIDLPGKQQELIDQIKATGKPFVVVLFNGRPLTLASVDASSPAILEAWFPGVEAGNAVADVLFGNVNPGGKLPVSFPQALGQIPIYYNHEPTGSPLRSHVQVQLALPRPRLVRPAVRVRLRAELHDVLGHEPAAEHPDRLEERRGHRVGRRPQPRQPRWRRRGPALHP
jgi:beta-glucosidase